MTFRNLTGLPSRVAGPVAATSAHRSARARHRRCGLIDRRTTADSTLPLRSIDDLEEPDCRRRDKLLRRRAGGRIGSSGTGGTTIRRQLVVRQVASGTTRQVWRRCRRGAHHWDAGGGRLRCRWAGSEAPKRASGGVVHLREIAVSIASIRMSPSAGGSPAPASCSITRSNLTTAARAIPRHRSLPWPRCARRRMRSIESPRIARARPAT